MTPEQKDWQGAYAERRTPWDLRGPTGPLLELARSGYFASWPLSPGARVAVPLCGRGHDLKVFADLGCAVTGFDIAPAAVAEARALLTLNRTTAEVVVSDVLGLGPEFDQAFDLVYDYTSFCALPVHLRRAYIREMTRILVPRGRLLSLAFPMEPGQAGPPGRPPFVMTADDLAAATAGLLEPVESRAAEDSAVERRGAERWLLYRKP